MESNHRGHKNCKDLSTLAKTQETGTERVRMAEVRIPL